MFNSFSKRAARATEKERSRDEVYWVADFLG
jgi:hypothetical protein